MIHHVCALFMLHCIIKLDIKYNPFSAFISFFVLLYLKLEILQLQYGLPFYVH